LKRILLFLSSQVEGSPLLLARASTAALLTAWDKAAVGWALQVLIHREDGRSYVFLRGSQGLIKHPELAQDGGVVRGDFNKDRSSGHFSKDRSSGDGYASGHDNQASGSDPWQSKSDPWKSYFKSWSTDSQSSWDGHPRGWEQDGYGK
jgi:hypothetical protein